MNSQHNFDLFLNCLTDGVVFVNDTGHIEFTNIAALQMLGLGRHQLIGADVNNVIILQKDQQLLTGSNTPFQKVLKSGQLFNTDQDHDAHYVIARNDRTVFPVQFIVLPFELENAKGILVVMHDRSNEEKIETAKSEFVSLVSHQLRTPVSIISWYVEKLMHQRKGALNNRQMEYLQEVYRSNRRIIDLVQAVVNVSRTDLSRLKHKHQPIDVKPVIERVIVETQELMNEHAIKVTTDLQDVHLNDSDQELVSVTCRNVFNNAIRYTADGGQVSISLHPITKGTTLDPDTGSVAQSDGALVTVVDNGVGILDEEKYRVFTKLFRGANVKPLNVNGIGLGLYVADSFTKVLGGHIWFESELRIGSTFYIYFPNE